MLHGAFNMMEFSLKANQLELKNGMITEPALPNGLICCLYLSIGLFIP